MLSDNVTIDYLDQAQVLEDPDRPPESRSRDAVALRSWPEALLRSPGDHTIGELRLAGDLGGFRIYPAVIGPQPEEPDRRLGLAICESDPMYKALTDHVQAFEEGLW